MDELERCSEFVADLTRDAVHHPGGVLYGGEPEGARHLFLREICTRHLNHSTPVAFDESVGRLTAGGSRVDGRAVGKEPCCNVLREKLGVAVGAELCGEATGLGTEAHERSNNCLRVETFEADNPVISSRAVYQNKRKTMAEATKAITKRNVEMNSLEIFCR